MEQEKHSHSKTELTIADIDALKLDDIKLSLYSLADLIIILKFVSDCRKAHLELGLVQESIYFDKIKGICNQEIFRRLRESFNV